MGRTGEWSYSLARLVYNYEASFREYQIRISYSGSLTLIFCELEKELYLVNAMKLEVDTFCICVKNVTNAALK